MRNLSVVGQDIVVGIATCCRLDSPGLKSWWGRDLHRSRLAPGGHPAPCTMGTGSLSRA